MQRVLAGLNPPAGPDFVSVYLDDVIVFSRTLDDHLQHLSLVINRLSQAGLKLKPSKCHFISQEVQYLGHILTPQGMQPNPDRIAAVRDYPVPKSVREVRQFLGLASYYRRFIKGFAKTAQPLHPVAYASRSLSPQEKRYAITELETLAVVWAVSHFHAYLYGHDVQVFTDHSAVKAVLETPNPSGKHARWWSQTFGSGIKNLQIIYRDGKENSNADALSRCPVGGDHMHTSVTDVQVAQVRSTAKDVAELLQSPPVDTTPDTSKHFSLEQGRDPESVEMRQYLSHGELPSDSGRARKIAAQAPSFALVDNILYFIDAKRNNQRRCVVPKHLRTSVMEENHSGPLAGHFSGEKLYKALVRHWWWPTMYTDVVEHCTNCPQCAIVHSSGRLNRPPLHPIPVQRVFQIIGVDVMDLTRTEAGNKHVVVFQDFLSK